MRHLPVEVLDQLGDVPLRSRSAGMRVWDGYMIEQVLAKTTGGDLRLKDPVGPAISLNWTWRGWLARVDRAKAT